MSIYDECHKHGGMTKHAFEIDPKRLGFIAARYKFVAKMFEGKQSVLEVGCADGFCSRIVAQAVGQLTCIDLEMQSIKEAKIAIADTQWHDRIEFVCADFMKSMPGERDAIFALDVLEHIEPQQSVAFLKRMRAVAPVAIIGMPSLESQAYASQLSIEGHVNCMTGPQLRGACEAHWSQVFLFGMNDEVLHTGFSRMQQYRFALCVA